MAGVINRAVGADGIIAFQDRENPEKFEYFPSSVQSVLGDTMESFLCQYYGIGGKPQWVQAGNNSYLNLAGGIVQGKVRFDATKKQLEAIKEEISRVYKIDDAVLTPVILSDTKAQPVFAQGAAGLGGNSKYGFPDGFSVGESFNFNIDSGNSLFAQLIAARTVGSNNAPASPTIGMNIRGKLQLYGEPFKARLTADLSQVWEYTRTQVDAAARIGWFNFSGSFDKIAQDLQKNSIIKMEFIEGRADSEFGLQLLESTKVVFEAINNQITSGEGMFRFEPNPDPQEPKDPEKSWLAELAPYSVGINTSFASNSFSQSIAFEQEVDFTGIKTIEVSSSMNLGVLCSSTTENMFMDVTRNENGCITAQKAEKLGLRIAKEIAAKEAKIQDYEERLLDGKIDLKTYEALVAMLNNRMLTEVHDNDRRSPEDMIREVEDYVFHNFCKRVA